MTSLPARGTRPRNRREITLEAATELFARDGYAAVSMGTIAEATNVGASALYRHFPGKADLLIAAIESGLLPYAEVLDEAESLSEAAALEHVLARLSDVTLDHRTLGVLWQRESRNLPADDQRALRERLSGLTRRLAAVLRGARPDLDAAGADLLAWCTMGALVSPSFHSLRLPRPQFTAVLRDIVTTIAALPMPASERPDVAAGPRETAPESRRDALITVATRLFAERGFAATGIDDIGDAAGIAGPSVYSHFESKQAILVAAIERANAILRADAEVVLARDTSAQEKLGGLIDTYVRMANRDRSVIRTLLSEVQLLPAPERETARALQRSFIDAWVELFRTFADVEPVPARIRVQAVLLVVNDAVQTPHLRELPTFEGTLSRLSRALLMVD